MLKFCIVNPKVGPLSSHSCNCSGALWTPRHQASKVRTHPSVASFTAFFPCSTKFAYQATTECCGNLATRLQVSQLCSTTQLSPLSGWPLRSTDEATMRYTLAANFASGVGPCTGIVEPFKHLLRVTTHPHFLALEL